MKKTKCIQIQLNTNPEYKYLRQDIFWIKQIKSKERILKCILGQIEFSSSSGDMLKGNVRHCWHQPNEESSIHIPSTIYPWTSETTEKPSMQPSCYPTTPACSDIKKELSETCPLQPFYMYVPKLLDSFTSTEKFSRVRLPHPSPS